MKKDGLIVRMAVALAVSLVFAFALSRIFDLSFAPVFTRMGSLIAMLGLAFWVCVKLRMLDCFNLKDRGFSKNKFIFCAVLALITFAHTIAFKFLEKRFDWFAQTKTEWEAYQFRKTMIDADAFQKPVDKNIAEIGE